MKMCSVHIGGMEKSEKDFSTVVDVRKLSWGNLDSCTIKEMGKGLY